MKYKLKNQVDLLRESVDLKCVSADPCRRNNQELVKNDLAYKLLLKFYVVFRVYTDFKSGL